MYIGSLDDALQKEEDSYVQTTPNMYIGSLDDALRKEEGSYVQTTPNMYIGSLDDALQKEEGSYDTSYCCLICHGNWKISVSYNL